MKEFFEQPQDDRPFLSLRHEVPVRRLFSSILPGLFLVISVGCRSTPKIGEPAPPFAVSDLNGNSLSLTKLRGKVVVLHFWATWCPPCLLELPQLVALFKNQDPEKIVFLPVNTDRANSKYVREFLDSWGFDIEVYRDPGGKVAARYGTVKYPETYILDAKGILRRKVIGAGDWGDSEWVQYLQTLLGDTGGHS